MYKRVNPKNKKTFRFFCAEQSEKRKQVTVAVYSLLAANFADLEKDIKAVEQGGAEWLHLDVMDGAFVPNISFGPCVISSIRKISSLYFDVHLMINEPIRYIEDYKNAGADSVTVHVEACSDVKATLEKIRALGMKAGLSVKPKTPVSEIEPYLQLCDMILIMTVEPGFGGQKLIPETVGKVGETVRLLEKHGVKVEIEADGGITEGNIGDLVREGLTVCVAGSSVFRAEDKAAAIKALRNA